jgi:hypothetical protein
LTISSSIPPFSCLGIFGLFIFLALISKIQYTANSNLVITMFVLLAFSTQLATTNILYMEVKNILEYMDDKDSIIE